MIDTPASVSDDVEDAVVTKNVPRLPAEILADIIEIAILTASPCPLVPPSAPSSSLTPTSPNEPPASPFTTPLRGSYTSAWGWVGHLLYVSKFFHSVARPLLLRTLTLESDAASASFFTASASASASVGAERARWDLEKVERAWLGNISALERQGFEVDPVALRFSEAAWYEECSGGFVVGHAYASRPKRRKDRKAEEKREGRAKEKQYRSVSVFWAEEQLVEEVSDPDRTSSSEESDSGRSDVMNGDIAEDEEEERLDTFGFARSLPSTSHTIRMGERVASQRRRSHQEASIATGSGSGTGSGSTIAEGRDPRVDRPHEPAWQTLYSRHRQRRSSPIRIRAQLPSSSSSSSAGAPMNQTSISASNIGNNPNTYTQLGPSEGDLDPWDMQDAQERLAALANSEAEHLSTDAAMSPSTSAKANTSDPHASTSSPPPSESVTEGRGLISAQQALAQLRRRKREIYAYHLCTATLEPWINPLLSSLRSLRLITITFYPGHLLDDDKLEHMLRRILSPSECPRLETLLIRIVFDAASAGSRMRRFERTKTIAGAVDRIGDERVRVMLVNNRVGEGELVALPKTSLGAGSGGGEEVNPVSRKAITLTKEGWWARILQQNHHSCGPVPAAETDLRGGQEGSQGGSIKAQQERQLSDWQMFFPPSQHFNPTHLVNLIHHCDPWPDHPNPVS